jgi:putative ABC transport system permease protein
MATNPPSVGPPRLARWLLGRAASPADRPFLLGDAEEEMQDVARRRGDGAARRWYWRQAIASIVPLLRRRLSAGGHPTLPDRPSDPMWREYAQDLRYAARLARRSPLMTTAVIATMALGIGSITAVFGVVQGVLLQPLPFAASERVVRIGTVVRNGNVAPTVAYPDIQDYERLARGFDAFGRVSQDEMTLVPPGGEPVRLFVGRIDEGYQQVFAFRPTMGRLLSPSEMAYGAPGAVLLTHRTWIGRFGGDPRIVGKTIVLDDEPHTVVGVLPASDFGYPSAALDAYTPLAIAPKSWMRNRGALWLGAVARVKPGVTLAQARAELVAIGDGIARANPDANAGLSAHVISLREAMVGPVRDMLALLAGAVAAILLVACANIGNLLLGRAHTRTREFAVRAALGGSTARVRRQVLTESIGLAAIGGALALAIVPLLMRGLLALYPGTLPRHEELRVDLVVVGLAIAAALLAGLLAGLPAARRAGALDLTRDLRDGGRSGGTRAQAKLSGALVVAQVAVSVMLVFSAALLGRTFLRVARNDPGFDPRGLVSFSLAPSAARYASPDQVRQLYASLHAAIGAIPGVKTVASTTQLPFAGGTFNDTFVREDKGDQGPRNPMASVAMVTPALFPALGISMVRGRTLTERDDERAPRVVVINERLAERVFPGEDPVGKRIEWQGVAHWEIVGVARATRQWNLATDPEPVLYAPASVFGAGARARFVVVKTTVPPERVTAAIRRAVSRVDATLSINDLSTMEARVAASLAPERFRATLGGALGSLALVLATLGLYAVVAYTVVRRTREIGIRMALGEDAGRVQRGVLLGALRLGAAGTAIGAMLALGAGGWLSSFLVGVGARDAGLLAAVSAVLLAVAALAAYLPARRASRVDPVVALRGE